MATPDLSGGDTRNLPRFSVIIPNFNGGLYLERAICSVLDQGYDDLELLVIDGGSTDDSIETILRYESDLAGWVLEPDAGPAAAINKGLAKATSDLVGVLLSDDLYLPGTLHTVARSMTAAATSGGRAPAWAVGHCIRIGRDDEPLGELTAAAAASLVSFLSHDSGLLPLSASFWRRDLLQRCGGFDRGYRWAYDYELACRLMVRGVAPAILPQALTAKREAAAVTEPGPTLARGLEYIAAARRHGEALPLAQRCALWVNCDVRERIYTLAQAESRGQSAKRYLLQELLRHPWWLADDMVRRALRHGVPHHPLPAGRAA